MPSTFRTAVLLSSLTILCIGLSGYSSGCGADNAPNPPRVEVDPPLVELTAGVGDTTSRSRSVAVTQATGLSVAVEYDSPPPAEWLTALLTTTGNSSTLLLTASPRGLGPGTHEGLVVVRADEHDEGRVHVVLTVTP